MAIGQNKTNFLEGLPRIWPTRQRNIRTVMKHQATVLKFIERRAQGQSYWAIAQQLQVAMDTHLPIPVDSSADGDS